MRIIDPGHKYLLHSLDNAAPETLTFAKRSGGPVVYDEEHPGTTTQEVIRVAIDRIKYVDTLLPCDENSAALFYLRMALWSLEARAYRRKCQHLARVDAPHRESPVPFFPTGIEDLPICPSCGHICCGGDDTPHDKNG